MNPFIVGGQAIGAKGSNNKSIVIKYSLIVAALSPSSFEDCRSRHLMDMFPLYSVQ